MVMKRIDPLLVVVILLCAACHAYIRVAPGERTLLGSQSHADIAGADLEEKIAHDLVTVRNVIDGLRVLELQAKETANVLGRVVARVYTQAENDRIRALLQSYLNYRSVLLRLLGYYSGYETVSREDLRLKSFLLAYACGLTVFREGIVLVTSYRDRPRARAKLNEAEPLWGIPPNLFESVYKNITDLTNVRLLGEAWDYYEAQLPRMTRHGLAEGSEIAWLHDTIRVQQQFVEEKAVAVWEGKWDVLWRQVQAYRQVPAYNAIAVLGTFAGNVRVWISPPHITQAQIHDLKQILQPGDIILERRNWFLSNGFLPGFWKHMALYVGSAEDLERRGLATHPFVQPHWERFRQSDRHGHQPRVIEVVSAGVIFSPLEHTAAADDLAVLRPRVSESRKNAAIAQAFSHYGKPYDFDFDFFSTDKLVCSELVYRAYDEPVHGEGIRFPIVRIMGRDTMPPDEVVRMFAWERSMDGELVAQGLESTSQFALVLFLRGDEWAGRADLVGLEEFIRSVERPGTSTGPGGPPRPDH
jgi:muconolactone delta-isomerase